ncbi:alpha/beta hydrolase [Mycolicibacterium litorale]|uniref:Alpha/beta hydrolase n=1 Tax=Mycolicibacterium litorale TaxID=758802 RepID=A0A6S6P2K5_9MYCO|nr:alpha/beta hydrolase [Mycolicibacterium litorale]BCI52699.1 alpha/beta hydrolase [Mycolicibacterium litorale]
MTPTQDVESRLHPALRRFAAARTDLSPGNLGFVRESLDDRRRESAAALDVAGVEITEDRARSGRSAVGVRVYRGGAGPAPAVVYCHSGAFVLGNLDTDHLQCVQFARRAECTVVSVDYRLAPEHPYPAAVEDVMTALRWVAAKSALLQVDPSRIAVAGSSAGAALAALSAQAAATGSAPPVVFQLLHQPVLDDRPTPSRHEFTTTPGFDGAAVEQMWRHYRPADGAVPARSTGLTGLPPAFLSCSELDPLRDEALDYARRLLAAGVSTELHLFSGTCHGFDSLLPDWDTSRRLFDLQTAALRRALHD